MEIAYKMIEDKAFRTFIRIYSLFKSERLSTNIKLTLLKALIKSIMTYACPAWDFVTDNHLQKLQHLQSKFLSTIGIFPRAHTDSWFPHDFQTSIQIWLYNRIMQATSRSNKNHENENVLNIGQGEPRHIKYKRLKLGSGQAYDRSSD
jgi:hypothetical protein